jgi:hypothetical protein
MSWQIHHARRFGASMTSHFHRVNILIGLLNRAQSNFISSTLRARALQAPARMEAITSGRVTTTSSTRVTEEVGF